MRQDGAATIPTGLETAMAAVTPTMGRRRLGGVLRKLRGDAKLTNTQAASASGVSTAKISRLETGHNVVYIKDVRGLLEAYDPSPTMRDKVLRFAQLAEQQGWWEEFDDVLPPDFDLYLSVEEAAATLLVFNTTLVHGLLQTEDYA
ncbi:MAG: helix-turn-helix domain-containing protein, partial [Nocardioidaceae bacterium]